METKLDTKVNYDASSNTSLTIQQTNDANMNCGTMRMCHYMHKINANCHFDMMTIKKNNTTMIEGMAPVIASILFQICLEKEKRN